MAVRRWLLVAALVMFVPMGCGSDETVTTPEDLDTALLTAADLGTGWTQQQQEVFDTWPEGMPALDPGMWCPQAGSVADDLDVLVGGGGAFVELQSDESDARTYHGVTERLWSTPDAAGFVDTATAGFDACVGQTWDVDQDATASVVELVGEPVGDDSTMALVTYVTPGPDGDYEWRGRTIAARFGATAMVLQELDVQRSGSEPRLTDTEWQQLVELAASKVEASTDR